MLPPIDRAARTRRASPSPSPTPASTRRRSRPGRRRDGDALRRQRPRRSGSRPRRSRTRCCCSRARRRSRQVKRRTDGLTLFYTDLDRTPCRGARDRQDGPPRGRLEHGLHRRPAGAGGGPHRRGGQRLPLHPARHESRAHPDRRGGGRHRPRGARGGRRCTPTSASSSAARSARTRRSSIRSRNAGPSSRPPT